MMKPDFTWVQHLLGKMLPFAKWGWQSSLFLCSDHLVINKQEVGSIPSWLGSWAQKQRYYAQPDRPAFPVKMQHARPKTVSPEFLSSKSQSAEMQLHCAFLLILTLVQLFVVAPMSSYLSSLGSWPLAMRLPGSSLFGSPMAPLATHLHCWPATLDLFFLTTAPGREEKAKREGPSPLSQRDLKEHFSSLCGELYVIIYDLVVMRDERKHLESFTRSVVYFCLWGTENRV